MSTPNTVAVSILSETGARLDTKAHTLKLEADGSLEVIGEKQHRRVPAGSWRSFDVTKLDAVSGA